MQFGFFIARIFAFNIYMGVFLARIINFIIILILGHISIKKIPFGKILLTAYLMIPMMMQLGTAISVDSLMNALIILFISYTLNLAFKKEDLNKKEIILFLFLTIFVGISKITYIPLLGIGILLAKRRSELKNKHKIILGVLSIVICLGSFVILSKLNSGYENESAKYYLEKTGVNSSEQISGIINSPIGYLKMLWNNFEVNGDSYVFGVIGEYMGWLTITAPVNYVILYIILLFASIFVEKNEVALDLFEKIWFAILSLGMAVLVVTGLYIEWTQVGADVVAGVQGRYFLPIAILFLLALSKKDNYVRIKNPNIMIPLSALFINILFIRHVILFFI